MTLKQYAKKMYPDYFVERDDDKLEFKSEYEDIKKDLAEDLRKEYEENKKSLREFSKAQKEKKVKKKVKEEKLLDKETAEKKLKELQERGGYQSGYISPVLGQMDVISDLQKLSKHPNEKNFMHMTTDSLKKYRNFAESTGMKKKNRKGHDSEITSVVRTKSRTGSSWESPHIPEPIKEHHKKTGRKVSMEKIMEGRNTMLRAEEYSTAMDFSPEGYRGAHSYKKKQVEVKDKKTGKKKKIWKKTNKVKKWKFERLVNKAVTGKPGPSYKKLKKILVKNAIAADSENIQILVEKHHLHGDTNVENQSEFMKFRQRDYRFNKSQRKNANKLLEEVLAEVIKGRK